MLRRGSKGDDVAELQTFLINAGYDLGRWGADGDFGPATEAAVRQYQADQGLDSDGIVGPDTRAAMAATAPTAEADEAEADEDVADDGKITPEGADEAEGFVGIMAGGTVHEIDNGDQPNYWVVSYEYPPGSGHSFFYTFDSKEQLESFTGPDFGGITDGGIILEDALNEWTDAGDSNEIVGIPGSFGSYMDDITQQVLTLAGIDDPTRLGLALQDPSIQILIAKAAEGDIDTEGPQFLAMLRNNEYYQNVVYPGIENFYGMTDNPEGAYAMYKQNVSANLALLGIPKDADGSYDSQMVKLLDAGVSDTEFNKFAPTYLRASGNDGYRQSLNQWLTAAGIPTLDTFDSLFDVMAGTEPADVARVVELAGISYAASEQGLGVGTNLIKEIAERTDLSEAQIAEKFLQSDRDLLSLGAAGLRTLGLTQEDIISTRSGFTRGTRSLGEMEALIAKGKKEAGIADDPTATIFTDFNREGAPIKKGLQSTISEGA